MIDRAWYWTEREQKEHGFGIVRRKQGFGISTTVIMEGEPGGIPFKEIERVERAYRQDKFLAYISCS